MSIDSLEEMLKDTLGRPGRERARGSSRLKREGAVEGRGRPGPGRTFESSLLQEDGKRRREEGEEMILRKGSLVCGLRNRKAVLRRLTRGSNV